ncbi:MAG: transposase [Candidatus Omnitrophica bacterium]|nr:transposase [Candidatus Omnitrophota bacterium]
MSRELRTLIDGGYYHLTAKGNNDLFLFDRKDRFERFRILLKAAKEKFAWRLYHYCIMSNHVHLLAQVLRGEDLPCLMRYLLLEYSRWYGKQTGYKGHVWRGRYKCRIIEKEDYLLKCGRYIETNPLRAGVVDDLSEYPWSSYHHYMLGKPDELVDSQP